MVRNILPNWINALLSLLTQFTGARGGIDNVIVNYGIAALMYAVLFTVALGKYRSKSVPREHLLIWGFGLGLSRELFMLAMAVIYALGLINPVTLHSVFPPLEHFLSETAMIVIAAGYICFFVNKSDCSRSYLRFSVSFSVLAYLSTFWWWANFIEANPTSKFGQVWCEWVFRLNASFWLVLAAIVILVKSRLGTRKIVVLALLFFTLSEFLKIPDIVLHEVYEYIFTPIARTFYLCGIFTLGYVYFRELSLEKAEFERSMALESEKNTALLRNASDGIHILNYDGNIVEASESFCGMLGYRRDEVIGMNVSQWDAGFANADEQLKIVQKQFEKPVRSQFETKHKRKDGSIFEVEISGHPLVLAGQKVLFNSSRDITHRKLRTKQIQESEERLRLALLAGNQGWFDLNVQTGEIAVSPEYVRMIGYDPNNFHTNFNEWKNRIHPDDLDAVETAFKACLANNSQKAMEYRRITAKGSWVWIYSVGKVTEWDADNHPLRVIGTHTDITERKLAENDLRIAATAFESQEGMMVTDTNNMILRVNQAFTSITGYKAEDVIGKNPRMLSSGRQDSTFYSTMWKNIGDSGSWAGEIWNRRKNGEVYPEYLTITAVKDKNGIITNYVASLTDITERKQADDEIQHLAFYDPLTLLPNRRLLIDRLNQALAFSSRSGREGALLLLDLDHFKNLNDTLGHNIGDILLQQVAERLTSCLREGDTVARFGGDEFVLVLEDLSDSTLDAATQAEVISDKILTTLNQPYLLDKHKYHNSVSIGVTLFNDNRSKIEELLRQADIAMYQAKKAGRNKIRFFDPKMQETINTRVSLESELKVALAENQFQLHYQIQVDHLGHPLGAEALIRWIHPERGMISPLNFIPMAEETDLILPIGEWVLETACAQLKAWQQDKVTCDLTISINVSAKQFGQANFVAQVQTNLKRYNIKPKHLKLELTESLLLDNIDGIIISMIALETIGVEFSLDDFGTGYSSLQYLKMLPMNQLKIDQSFVRDIVNDSSDRSIVRTIIAMAKSLGFEVIAEGVETEEQQNILLNKGCKRFQGYLFGRPVPIDEFEALLRKS